MLAKPDCLAELLDISLQHVKRSRTEPGCIKHSVQINAENDQEIVFYEEWADEAALLAHFEVREARDFVKQSRALSVPAAGAMKIYGAEKLKLNFK